MSIGNVGNARSVREELQCFFPKTPGSVMSTGLNFMVPAQGAHSTSPDIFPGIQDPAGFWEVISSYLGLLFSRLSPPAPPGAPDPHYRRQSSDSQAPLQEHPWGKGLLSDGWCQKGEEAEKPPENAEVGKIRTPSANAKKAKKRNTQLQTELFPPWLRHGEAAMGKSEQFVVHKINRKSALDWERFPLLLQ